jgi:hypothetical protein
MYVATAHGKQIVAFLFFNYSFPGDQHIDVKPRGCPMAVTPMYIS